MIKRIGRFASWKYLNLIRRFLPSRPVFYGGIPTGVDARWGDKILSRLVRSRHDLRDQPGYELTLIEGLRQTVRKGDAIVVVGGGIGVTATMAALLTGPTGSVQCYEGSHGEFAIIKETVARNDVADRVTIHHSVVGPAIGVYGSTEGAAQLGPEQLPGRAWLSQQVYPRLRMLWLSTPGSYNSD